MQFNEKDLTAATLTNLADFDFTPEMGAMYGGRPFPLRKGESLTANLTVVEHLATHLARQSLLRGNSTKETEGRALWNGDSITALAQTFIKKIGNIDAPKTLTKEEILLSNTKDFNESQVTEEPIAESGYKDKKEVVAELEKRGIAFDARATKATLEKLLVD